MDTATLTGALTGSLQDSLQYAPVIIILALGLGLGCAMIFATQLLGPSVFHPKKNEPFECGVPPHGDTKRRFSVRFYLVAILFLLFDVEIIFFYPYAIVYRDFLRLNSFIVWEMLFFVAILLVGYVYVRRRGALEWD